MNEDTKLSLHRGMCRYGEMTWLSEDRYIGQSLSLYGEWAQNEIEFSAQFLSEDSVILDIGSNIGTHAVAFAGMASRGKVIAVEPQPELFGLLTENTRACSAANIELINAAAAATPGEAFIARLSTEGQCNYGGLSVMQGAAAEGENLFDRVPAIAIDSLNLKRLDFAKIDVEGDEPSVVKGMSALIDQHRPVVLCEVLTLKAGLELLEMFSPLGYTTYFVCFDAYSRDNFKGNRRNVFPLSPERALLFLPKGMPTPKADFASSLVRIESLESFALTFLDSVNLSDRIIARLYCGAKDRFSEEDAILLDVNAKRVGEEVDLLFLLSPQQPFTALCLAAANTRCILQLVEAWLETDGGKRVALKPALSNQDRHIGDLYCWLNDNPQLLFLDIPPGSYRSAGFRVRYHLHGTRVDPDFDFLSHADSSDHIVSQLYYGAKDRFSEEESVLYDLREERAGEAADLFFKLPPDQAFTALCLTVSRTRCMLRFLEAWIEKVGGDRFELKPTISNEDFRSGDTYYWLKDNPQLLFLDIPPDPYCAAVFRVRYLLRGSRIDAALQHMIAKERMHLLEKAGLSPQAPETFDVHAETQHQLPAEGAGPAREEPAEDAQAGPMAGIRDRGEPPVFGPTPEEVRKVINGEFDRNFYLDNNPDVRAAGIDPLEHYIKIGWREGRDPHPDFATGYYLEVNPAVAEALMNPFYHWVVSGKPQGIISPRMYMQQVLIENRFLEPSVDESMWRTFDCLPPEAIADRIAVRIDRQVQRLVLAFGHDNYTLVVGGIQLCTTLEQRAFEARGITYLQAHPIVPVATLLKEDVAQRYVLGLVLGGEAIGLCRSGDLQAALSELGNRFPDLSVDLVVHALLGHSAEFVAGLRHAARICRACFWTHDFYSICPMYNLLRNNILFCNAPGENSPACSLCIHGEERRRHRASMRHLFGSLDFTVVAPSQTTLDLWLAKSGLPHRDSAVNEHARLIATGCKTSALEKRLRVAFLGLPRYHKGWQSYSKLVMSLKDDPRYHFYLLGKEEKLYPAVEWREVVVGPDNPRAMTEALRREGIDVVVLWSLWPETFCLTAFESLAAGAFIVTCEGSGNIANLVRKSACGMVLADDDRLIESFRTGAVAARVKEAFDKGIPTGILEFSGMSADILIEAGEA